MKKLFSIVILVFSCAMLIAQAPDTVWSKTYGGSGSDSFGDIKQLADGSYIVVGGTSSNDGDVHRNQGGSDFWIFSSIYGV